MRRIVFFKLLLVVAHGCGGASPSSPPPDIPEPRGNPRGAQAGDPGEPENNIAPPKETMTPAVKQSKEFADDMCACKELACVDSVQKQMSEWAANNPEPPQNDLDAIAPHLRRLMQCAGQVQATAEPPEGKVGIAACDEYIDKYVVCVANSELPPEAKKQAIGSMEQVRKSWAETYRKDRSQVASLAESCRRAAENTAQVARDYWKCEW